MLSGDAIGVEGAHVCAVSAPCTFRGVSRQVNSVIRGMFGTWSTVRARRRSGEGLSSADCRAKVPGKSPNDTKWPREGLDCCPAKGMLRGPEGGEFKGTGDVSALGVGCYGVSRVG